LLIGGALGANEKKADNADLFTNGQPKASFLIDRKMDGVVIISGVM
jgi:hypothetical protein